MQFILAEPSPGNVIYKMTQLNWLSKFICTIYMSNQLSRFLCTYRRIIFSMRQILRYQSKWRSLLNWSRYEHLGFMVHVRLNVYCRDAATSGKDSLVMPTQIPLHWRSLWTAKYLAMLSDKAYLFISQLRGTEVGIYHRLSYIRLCLAPNEQRTS